VKTLYLRSFRDGIGQEQEGSAEPIAALAIQVKTLKGAVTSREAGPKTDNGFWADMHLA
jgi:hypothetical protein